MRTIFAEYNPQCNSIDVYTLSLIHISISDERQEMMLRRQIDELEIAIQSANEEDGGRYTVKQIEKTRKSLEVRLEKLNQKDRKDRVITFEELGVDHLYVDEAHSYKTVSYTHLDVYKRQVQAMPVHC